MPGLRTTPCQARQRPMTTVPQQAPLTKRSWFRDFELGLTGLVVKKTGARVPYSPGVISEVLAWFRFFFAVQAAKSEPGPAFTVAFSPDRARPWYLVWPVLRLAGARILDDTTRADVVFHFEDATLSNNPPPKTKPGAKLINFAAHDVSKSTVATAFAKAFGYPLTLDPRTTDGAYVEKGEGNGVHDGRVFTARTNPMPGKTYQRLVDNRTEDLQSVEDFRTPTVGGRPVVVFIKRREVTRRFANTNHTVTTTTPEAVFSQEEIAQIEATARNLGLDWGGLDVLRDRQEGRLYIVDANKTDMGPPTALPLAEKMRAARELAKAFRALVLPMEKQNSPE